VNGTIRSEPLMGTIVTVHVVHPGPDVDAAIDRAFGWFFEIEERCTRFNQQSELMQLTAQPGVPVPVSAILFEAIRFALLVADESGGAFDPTVGHRMEARGFNREHRTGSAVQSQSPAADISYRDVVLDPEKRTVTLRCPLTLDLGAVAKGLAVDTATRELEPFRDFAIDAGGDLYLGGSGPDGKPWSIGIRHPRLDRTLIDSIRLSNQAVCTSGDYERPAHIVDPRVVDPRLPPTPLAVASATVVAPGAMLADALATAAFVLGPEDGLELLNRMGVEGLILTPDLERFETRGFGHGV
jgi:thiamine biosynthesis lipoprotein